MELTIAGNSLGSVELRPLRLSLCNQGLLALVLVLSGANLCLLRQGSLVQEAVDGTGAKSAVPEDLSVERGIVSGAHACGMRGSRTLTVVVERLMTKMGLGTCRVGGGGWVWRSRWRGCVTGVAMCSVKFDG